MKRNPILFLEDMLESIRLIKRFSKGLDREKFMKNELRQNAIIRQFEIIGEAAKHLPDSFRKKYPKVPFREISGFRDVLIHAYFGADLERIWRVLERDLPELKKNLKEIIAKETNIN
ncbi:MAG: DUF86 domain-containing protein [Candidatus Aenigmatarchaeota archaeon]